MKKVILKESSQDNQFPLGFYKPVESDWITKSNIEQFKYLFDAWVTHLKHSRSVDFQLFKQSEKNKKFDVFIFSYLPVDKELRERRLKVLRWQKAELAAILPDHSPKYVLQGFTPEDIHALDLSSNNILYDGAALGISKARNVALENLYSKDLDFGIFLDDDAVFTTKNIRAGLSDSSSIKRTIDNMFSTEIDLVVPVNAAQTPWTKDFYKHLDIYEKYVWFTRTSHLKGTCFFLKNLSKYYQKKLFFDENFISYEDEEFAMQLIGSGFRPFVCNNLLLVEKNREHSTIFKDIADRVNLLNTNIEKIDLRYGIVNTNGTLFTKSEKGLKMSAKKRFLKENGHVINKIFLENG